MYPVFIAALIVCGDFVRCQSSDADIYFIQHSINTTPFREIGSFNIRTIRQSQNQAQFQSTDHHHHHHTQHQQNTEFDAAVVHNDRIANQLLFATPIDSNNFDEETKAMIRLAIADGELNRWVYRLRLCRKLMVAVKIDNNNGEEDLECSVASFIYLDRLVKAKFEINLIVNTGKL